MLRRGCARIYHTSIKLAIGRAGRLFRGNVHGKGKSIFGFIPAGGRRQAGRMARMVNLDF
jgi:hypothetical protein